MGDEENNNELINFILSNAQSAGWWAEKAIGMPPALYYLTEGVISYHFRQRSSKVHPDKFQDEDRKEKAGEAQAFVNAAKEYLDKQSKNKKMREAYFAEQLAKDSAVVQRNPDNIDPNSFLDSPTFQAVKEVEVYVESEAVFGGATSFRRIKSYNQNSDSFNTGAALCPPSLNLNFDTVTIEDVEEETIEVASGDIRTEYFALEFAHVETIDGTTIPPTTGRETTRLLFSTASDITIISEKVAQAAGIYGRNTNKELDYNRERIIGGAFMNFHKYELSRTWVAGQTVHVPTFNVTLFVRGVRLECVVVINMNLTDADEADVFLGLHDWGRFEKYASSLVFRANMLE